MQRDAACCRDTHTKGHEVINGRCRSRINCSFFLHKLGCEVFMHIAKKSLSHCCCLTTLTPADELGTDCEIRFHKSTYCSVTDDETYIHNICLSRCECAGTIINKTQENTIDIIQTHAHANIHMYTTGKYDNT